MARSILQGDKAYQVVGMVKAGLNDREIANKLGISYAGVQEVLAQHPEAQAAVTAATATNKRRLTRTLFMQATGYTFDEEKVFSNGLRMSVTRYVPPDFQATRYSLENLDPEHWRTIKAVELDMHGNLQIEDAPQDTRALALAALALFREAEVAPVIEGEVVAPVTAQEEYDDDDDEQEPEPFTVSFE